MNTTGEGPNSPPAPAQAQPEVTDAFDVPAPVEHDGSGKLADNIARLETDLDAERDGRKEERFYWICLSAFLLDPLVYRGVDNFPAFIIIFMFQLVVLIGLAHKLGVDWAVKGLGDFLNFIKSGFRFSK